MTRRTATIAVAATAIVATAAWTGIARVDLDPRPIKDGTYTAYVRTIAGHTDALAVDVPHDHRAETAVYAGGLAQLDIVGPTPRPFRITIKSEAIVGLITADDALPAAARAASERSNHEAI